MKRAPFNLQSHALCLLRSYHHWLGKDLVPPGSDPILALDSVPFPILSHGTEVDPILNYGNRAALKLWEMDWEEFTRTPSRLTAEAPIREERARLLAEVAEKGFIENYSGIRISKSGRRFRMSGGTVWNLLDEAGLPAGQAATFESWVEI
ncbi:MAG TPA: MEKHLA domain-containing protein [bacterium]|nr:MEKHLA domain-containing protein [bacterium]